MKSLFYLSMIIRLLSILLAISTQQVFADTAFMPDGTFEKVRSQFEGLSSQIKENQIAAFVGNLVCHKFDPGIDRELRDTMPARLSKNGEQYETVFGDNNYPLPMMLSENTFSGKKADFGYQLSLQGRIDLETRWLIIQILASREGISVSEIYHVCKAAEDTNS